MPAAPLHNQLLDTLDTLPPQLRSAALWMLDHPDDVALLSMRGQAERAGVPPATMTRLAQRLGFEGYEHVRDLYAQAVRQRAIGFADKGGALVARGRADGEGGVLGDMLAMAAGNVQRLGDGEVLAQVRAAARALGGARRLFALGLRSSFSVAFHFHYVASFIGTDCRLIDGAGSTGPDALRSAGASDALLAISVKPYVRATLDLVRHAATHGLQIVALTDSTASPLARQAQAVIVVPTDSPSFFHTMLPAFAVVELLAALLATQRGEAALDAIAATEAELAALDIYALGSERRRMPT
ncbi:MurR/RpiR family transcriptional regulator [Vineibacter terrae]|uniref:MurR/RpiR family transcriptional regulator n=1 Tax=Vineibacter terrae TaxID=2586908 RepID=UPI002E33B724|nr:MurR/RpiR family transcriptional regulator [Vineibacter terrae]HEX2888563.1 MurR/RpiR family transcriptional regulator [Vineibacter terrae]